jgi:hypothetical protein
MGVIRLKKEPKGVAMTRRKGKKGEGETDTFMSVRRK